MSSKTSKSSAKPKRSKSKRGRNKNLSKTKVVVRRLPPLIPEDLFLDSVKQWVNEETCTWSRFHQGRISKSKNKESIFSRAYFHFKTVEQVLEFHRGYDNHLFIDKQGNENRAVVEFAIYQKLPKEHKKPDPRQGTIESDPDYLAFLESLKAEEIQQASAKESSVSLESGATQLERLETRLANAAISAANAVEKPTTTPLLEHLRALKLGPKTKSPPPKSQMAILSPPGLPAKGAGSRAVKQSQQTRATHANEFPNKPRRERKKRERERERREREKERREKDKKNEVENNKNTVEKDREFEETDDNDKSKEKNSKEKESYRDKRREKKLERERQKSFKEKKTTESNKLEPPAITIVPRPQTEESKAESVKEREREKEAKRAPVKITIQQRQKEQIRQFIQKTNSSLPKKDLNTTDNDSKETTKESTSTTQKDVEKEENKGKNTPESSASSPSESKAQNSTSNASSTSNVSSNENRYRRRGRRHSADVKTPVIQILTKPQTQSTEPTTNTSSESTATTPSPSIRRTGRGYFGKRGGRW